MYTLFPLMLRLKHILSIRSNFTEYYCSNAKFFTLKEFSAVFYVHLIAQMFK